MGPGYCSSSFSAVSPKHIGCCDGERGGEGEKAGRGTGGERHGGVKLEGWGRRGGGVGQCGRGGEGRGGGGTSGGGGGKLTHLQW